MDEMEKYGQRIDGAEIVLEGSSDPEARAHALADLREIGETPAVRGTALARRVAELVAEHTTAHSAFAEDPELEEFLRGWNGLQGLTAWPLPGMLQELKKRPLLATRLHSEVTGKLRRWILAAVRGESDELQSRNARQLAEVIDLISEIDIYSGELKELRQLSDSLFGLNYREIARRIFEALREWDVKEAWRLYESLKNPPEGFREDVGRLHKEIYDVRVTRKKAEALLGRAPSGEPSGWPDVSEFVSFSRDVSRFLEGGGIPEPCREKLRGESERSLAAAAEFIEDRAGRALTFKDVRDFWAELKTLEPKQADARLAPQPRWFKAFHEFTAENVGRETWRAAGPEALDEYASELRGQRDGLPDFVADGIDSELGRVAEVVEAWRAMRAGEDCPAPSLLPAPVPRELEREFDEIYRGRLERVKGAADGLASAVGHASEQAYLDALGVADAVLKEQPGHALAARLRDEAGQKLALLRVENAVASLDIDELIRLCETHAGEWPFSYYLENKDVLLTWFKPYATEEPLSDWKLGPLRWMNWKTAVASLSETLPGTLRQAVEREEERRRGEWYALLASLDNKMLPPQTCTEIADSLDEAAEQDAALRALQKNFRRSADVSEAYQRIDAARRADSPEWDEARGIIERLDAEHPRHPDTLRLHTYFEVESAKMKGVEELSLVLRRDWGSVRECVKDAVQVLLDAVEQAWKEGLAETLDNLRSVSARVLDTEQEPAEQLAQLRRWEEWFAVEQAVTHEESPATLKRLLDYVKRGGMREEVLRKRLERLERHWAADDNLVMLSWAQRAFKSSGLTDDPVKRLAAESEAAGEGALSTLRAKAELTLVELQDIERSLTRRETDWKNLNSYLEFTPGSEGHPSPEKFRQAFNLVRRLIAILTGLAELENADLREPKHQERFADVQAWTRELPTADETRPSAPAVAARPQLLKLVERLEPLTKLTFFLESIRDAAAQARDEDYLYKSGVLAEVGLRVRALAEKFRLAGVVGGHMWRAVSKDCGATVFRTACVFERPPADLEELANRLDELNVKENIFRATVNKLWDSRPRLAAESGFAPEAHAEYLGLFPAARPATWRDYLYFGARLADVRPVQTVIEKSLHLLPEWVREYQREGIPTCPEES
jgi:hypothetical protein